MAAAHEHRIRVRYVETDQMGIVHHTNHLIYLEEGRTALMAKLGFPYEEVERRGLAMGVRRIDVRYRQVARYGDVIDVRTWIGGFRGASIDYDYELRRAADGELLLTGTVEVVCLGLGSLKPAPLPSDIRVALEREAGHAPSRGRRRSAESPACRRMDPRAGPDA
jgi:acyl-CoA thioester hydrolase